MNSKIMSKMRQKLENLELQASELKDKIVDLASYKNKINQSKKNYKMN